MKGNLFKINIGNFFPDFFNIFITFDMRITSIHSKFRTMKTNLKNFLIVAFLLLITATLKSQTSLPVIKPEDYSKWQTLQSFSITDDGSWVSWNISLVDGDDTLYIKNPVSAKLFKYPLSSGLLFSTDSKWAAFRVGYSEKEIDKMTEQKKPVKYKARLLELSSGKERLFENISSFTLTKDASHLIMAGYTPDNSKVRDLYLYNLKTGTMKNIGNVSEYSVNKPGNRLVYMISAENKKGNGVELMNLDNYTISFIENDTCTYRNLTWEREGNAFAFLKAVYDTTHVEQNHILFGVRNIYSKPEIRSYNPASDSTFPLKMRISENYRPSLSDDQKRFFFGVYDWTVKEKKEKKAAEAEKLPGVDVWHWKDDPIQPRQKTTYDTEKNFTFLFSWSPDLNKAVRITDEDMRQASPTGDGHFALATSDKAYKPSFREQYYDHYIVNTTTGEKKLILKNYLSMYGSSPAGKYVLYFKDKNWWVYDILKETHINITKDIPTLLWNTRDDSPKDIKPPFGMGGWFKDDRAILLYDEYDVWKVSFDGVKPVRLTNGKENNIIFRNLRLTFEYPYLEPSTDIYFSALGDLDKKMGYYRLTVKNKFEKLIFENMAVSGLRKAEKSDFFLYTTGTYSISPNVFRTTGTFAEAIKVSDTNPQQTKFAWGKSQLINYKNRDGKALQGSLFFPADYEPGKKYPMIVYIYELLSGDVNRYVTPSPRSSYNTTNYTSQGYFIFHPDIVYKTNHPGESAVACVVPAVEEVIKTGMIDEKRIGIMGHSWGAYQTSYIITQTNLFSAAVAGAPLIDMISMYNEIYWNSGGGNQNIFETSQGRLREPWWVIMQDYITNSPMYQAQNIKTPLLVTFGNSDGAVDWHQGIEMYTTMRRMEKPFIMLVYDGENHSLAKKENQLDYTKRVNDFFNTYLKGTEPPAWISKGKTYLDKKKEEEKAAKK
jgi:dipeptidyl aminopeptidase/acylaminoacyl peptidase